MAATAAEIPAETATATQTEYLSAVPIDTIQPHPKNIRHNATADDELVASILDQGLLQPLVVIPGDDEGTWLLIAGHRRLDGLKQAGYTFAPVVVRHDLTTEAEQIAAMLVENGRRADLTPIEEAEGFDALLGLDWTVERVAEATGRSQALIKQRRKLMTLTPKARDHVGRGQVTIDDALRLAKLPAAEQKRLEGKLGASGFTYDIATAEHRVEKKREIDARVKDLKAAGGKELKKPKDLHGSWQLRHATHGMVAITTTGRTVLGHDGCLGYVHAGDTNYPELWEVCTDPIKHDAELSEEQLERKAQRDAEEARRAEERAKVDEAERAHKIARTLRMEDLVSAIKVKPSQLDPILQALMVVALQDAVRLSSNTSMWRVISGIPDDANEAYEHVSRLTGVAVPKTLIAYLVDDVEHTLTAASKPWNQTNDEVLQIQRAYFATLTQAGHELNAADEAFIAEIHGEERDA